MAKMKLVEAIKPVLITGDSIHLQYTPSWWYSLTRLPSINYTVCLHNAKS